MNDNPSGVCRFNKSPVAGRFSNHRFRPYVGRKEKNSLEEVRAEARAQRKASERIDMEKLGSNNTEMDSENPCVLEAPVFAEERMGCRDYAKSREASACYRKAVLEEPFAGYFSNYRYRPFVMNEKISLEEIREQARAQRKASERIELEKRGSMDWEMPRLPSWLNIELLDLEKVRRGEWDNLEEEEFVKNIILEEETRYLDQSDPVKLDMDEIRRVTREVEERLGCRDYTKSKEASPFSDKTALGEPVSDRRDSDYLAYRNEGKQTSPGKQVTVIGGDSQG